MMKNAVIALGVIAVLVGCRGLEPRVTPSPGPVSTSPVAAVAEFMEQVKPCAKEAQQAALNKLYPVLGYIDETSVRSLDAADKAIACFRPWAAAIADTCQRDAIENWLDYYEGKNRRSREKLSEGKRETDHEESMREYREEASRVRKWEREHPFPKLPQCESK